MTQASKIKNKKQIIYNLKTYPKLSSLIGGIKQSELITIGARVGCGKTTFALNITCDLLDQNKKVLFCSCEMTKQDILNKINKSWDFNHNELNNLYIEDDRIKITPNFIEKMILKHNFKVIVIDYVQIMNYNVKLVTRELKTIANKYNVVIICLAQLNRNAENKEPQLSMLKDTGTIEQDSDEVWFIKQWSLKIAKNRKGMVGETNIIFHKEMSYIEESDDHIKAINDLAGFCIELLNDDQTKELGLYLLQQKLALLDFDLFMDICNKYLAFEREKTRVMQRSIKSDDTQFTYILNKL